MTSRSVRPPTDLVSVEGAIVHYASARAFRDSFKPWEANLYLLE